MVTVTPADGKQSLFTHWSGDRDALLAMKNDAVEEYVKYCDATLRNYFGAIKKNLHTQSNMLIDSYNFIIGLTRQLSINGVQDFDFYDKVFNGWNFDFSKENFPYTSSQYRKFSTRILQEAFKITDDVIDTI